MISIVMRVHLALEFLTKDKKYPVREELTWSSSFGEKQEPKTSTKKKKTKKQNQTHPAGEQTAPWLDFGGLL